jgi:hypothetical protein
MPATPEQKEDALKAHQTNIQTLNENIESEREQLRDGLLADKKAATEIEKILDRELPFWIDTSTERQIGAKQVYALRDGDAYQDTATKEFILSGPMLDNVTGDPDDINYMGSLVYKFSDDSQKPQTFLYGPYDTLDGAQLHNSFRAEMVLNEGPHKPNKHAGAYFYEPDITTAGNENDLVSSDQQTTLRVSKNGETGEFTFQILENGRVETSKWVTEPDKLNTQNDDAFPVFEDYRDKAQKIMGVQGISTLDIALRPRVKNPNSTGYQSTAEKKPEFKTERPDIEIDGQATQIKSQLPARIAIEHPATSINIQLPARIRTEAEFLKAKAANALPNSTIADSALPPKDTLEQEKTDLQKEIETTRDSQNIANDLSVPATPTKPNYAYVRKTKHGEFRFEEERGANGKQFRCTMGGKPMCSAKNSFEAEKIAAAFDLGYQIYNYQDNGKERFAVIYPDPGRPGKLGVAVCDNLEHLLSGNQPKKDEKNFKPNPTFEILGKADCREDARILLNKRAPGFENHLESDERKFPDEQRREKQRNGPSRPPKPSMTTKVDQVVTNTMTRILEAGFQAR